MGDSGMIVVQKLWGYEHIYHNGAFCMKMMQVTPGYMCSIHRHKIKDEAFMVTEGQLVLEMGEDPENMETTFLHEGGVVRVPPNTWHRFSNVQQSTCYFVEASTHDYVEDNERHTPSQRINDD